MTDIDPAEVKRSHNQHGEAGCFWTAHLWGGRCEPYRLADALEVERNGHALSVAALVGAHDLLSRVEGFAQTKAIAAHAVADEWRERQWLDLLAVLERG